MVDDLCAVERAQLDGVELEVLADVEGVREARADLVGDDAKPHRPCLYQLDGEGLEPARQVAERFGVRGERRGLGG
jgi:hypothetical protein